MRLIRVWPSPSALGPPLGCNVPSPRINLWGEVMTRTWVRVRQESNTPVPGPNQVKDGIVPGHALPFHRSSIATSFYCEIDIGLSDYRPESCISVAHELTDEYKYSILKPYVRRSPSKSSDFHLHYAGMLYSVAHDHPMPLPPICRYMSKIDHIIWYR